MSLSPDGRTLVYSGMQAGSDPAIYVRDLDGFESRAIPGTEGGVVPFFSPDQQQIGFFSAGRLKRVSLLGGLPVVLCSTSGAVMGALWTEDNEILYTTITTRVPHRVSAIEGGEGQPVATDDLEAGASISAPRLLSGVEDTILVSIDSPSLDGPHVGVLNLKDGRWKTVVRGLDARYLSSGHLLFAQEDRLVFAPFDTDSLELAGPEQAAPLAPIAISQEVSLPRAHTTIARDETLIYPSGRFGQNRLFQADQSGNARPLGLEGRGVRVAPSGRRLAIWTWQEILIHDIQRSDTTRLLTKAQSWYPVWSVDGEKILFSDLQDDYRGVFEIDADGGEVRELVTLDYASIPTSLAPDGTVMGYQIHPETNRDIWALSPEGELTMVLASRHNERAGAISPDGTLFAYVSDEEGSDEVYLRQFPDSGRKWRVTQTGGVAPVWSREGSALLYRRSDEIMSVSIGGSGTALRMGAPQEIFSSDRIYLDRFGNPTYDISPDGDLIIPISEPDDVRTRVVLNWQP
jgi:serine/threonine-protein kinase